MGHLIPLRASAFVLRREGGVLLSVIEPVFAIIHIYVSLIPRPPTFTFGASVEPNIYASMCRL